MELVIAVFVLRGADIFTIAKFLQANGAAVAIVDGSHRSSDDNAARLLFAAVGVALVDEFLHGNCNNQHV